MTYLLKILVALTVPVILLGGAAGCSKRSPASERLAAPQLSHSLLQKVDWRNRALWVTTTDYRAVSQLHRVNPENGKAEHKVQYNAQDIKLIADNHNHDDQFFLLTRNSQDSVRLLRGSNAEEVAIQKLPELSNPQTIARDSTGCLWLASYDSHELQMFSDGLQQKLSTVDLNGNADLTDGDGKMELAILSPFSSGNTMIVVSQRLDRRTKNWQPDSHSGIAIIDTALRQVIGSKQIDVVNAQSLVSRGNELFLAAGAGHPDLHIPGRLQLFRSESPARFVEEPTISRTMSGQLLDVDFSGNGITSLVWNPEALSTCIDSDGSYLHCETTAPEQHGYFFSHVLRMGGVVFASWRDELWAIPLDGGPIEKQTFPQPIEGLTRGP